MIDGGAIDRIVTIWSEETVTISRVAIRNGNAGTRSGGGIANWGALEMNESTVTANRSVNCGGGIASFGGENTTATITSSTISGNSAAACAGGIYNQGQFGVITIIGSTIRDNEATGGRGGGITNFGSATITGSTISGNTATTDGGGIWTSPDSGALTLTSSTVSGNSADGEGGGIYVSESGAFATGLVNSTVAFNTADSDGDGIGGGGGVANAGPAASLDHTIIARNADAGSPSAPDCAGEFTSQGHNLIQDPPAPSVATSSPARTRCLDHSPIMAARLRRTPFSREALPSTAEMMQPARPPTSAATAASGSATSAPTNSAGLLSRSSRAT